MPTRPWCRCSIQDADGPNRDTSGRWRETIAHGRYLDRYEKRDGVWRILYRKIIYDWSEVRPYDKELFARISRGSTKASPDENDPLYTELKLFKRGVR